MAVLTKELQDVIRKNLPEHTAGALKERLAELEEKEEDCADLRSRYAAAEVSNHELSKEVRAQRKALKEIEAREADCKRREDRSEDAERNIQLRILRIQLNEQDKRINDLQLTNLSLTRNLEYRNKVVRRDAEGSLVAESIETREVE